MENLSTTPASVPYRPLPFAKGPTQALATVCAYGFAPEYKGKKCDSVALIQLGTVPVYTVIYSLPVCQKSPAPGAGTLIHGQGSALTMEEALIEAREMFCVDLRRWEANKWI